MEEEINNYLITDLTNIVMEYAMEYPKLPYLDDINTLFSNDRSFLLFVEPRRRDNSTHFWWHTDGWERRRLNCLAYQLKHIPFKLWRRNGFMVDMDEFYD